MAQPGPHNDRVLRYVTACCPRCRDADPRRPLPAALRFGGYLAVDGEGEVWLVLGCPEHGMVRARYDDAAEALVRPGLWSALAAYPPSEL